MPEQEKPIDDAAEAADKREDEEILQTIREAYEEENKQCRKRDSNPHGASATRF